jgi:biotin operon repressor
VVRFTLNEAKRWLQSNSIDPPQDLVDYLDRTSTEAEGACADLVKPSLKPLTENQRTLWDLLSGKVLMAKELALLLPGKPSESAVTKMIKQMVDNGYSIVNTPTLGYYPAPSAQAVA